MDNMDKWLKEGERVDDLQYKGLKIIQNPAAFRFGMDAVLLAGFSVIRRGECVADLGTGSGIIAILLSGRMPSARIDALEIQPQMADMAKRSVGMNGLDGVVRVVEGDIKRAEDYLEVNAYHAVVCNPPYKKAGDGAKSASHTLAAARHEVLCTLEDVVKNAARLMKTKGRLYMIHRSDRFAELLYTMRDYGIEPKRIRMVQPSYGKPPNLMLIEGVKQGRSGVKWEPPLIVYGEDGEFTPELRAIYHMEGE
ncbi:MAG: tRNA1(Val) (adenine(37)-N6)-methyltransferase [Christensenellales bacterium]